MTPVDRVGGRVLLIDPDARVLLIHERIEDGSTHWLTPGGGVEAGEHPRAAAVREAYEETGLVLELAPDVEAVHVTRRLWSWGGTTYDQIDHFFVASVPAGAQIRPRGLTEVEQATVLGHRWWSVDELRGTDEVLLPADLADVLATLLRGHGGAGFAGGSAGGSGASSGGYEAAPPPGA